MSVQTAKRASRSRRARGRRRPARSNLLELLRPRDNRPATALDALRAVVGNLTSPLPRVLVSVDPDTDDDDELDAEGGPGRADTGAEPGVRLAASQEWPERKRKRKGPAKVICFANQSGGSGKTTSAATLAYILSERGFKVLVVDLDPQHDSCHIFGYTYPDQICGICLDSFKVKEEVSRGRVQRVPVENCLTGHKPEAHPNMFDVLVHGNFSIKEAIRPALVAASQPIPGLDIALSSEDLSDADTNFASMSMAEMLLNTALDDVRELYDYILIDSPASKSKSMINILVASDFVIANVKPELKEIRAVEALLRSVATVNLHLRKDNPVQLGGVLVGCLPSKKDGIIYQQWADQVPIMYPGKELPNVPRTVAVTQSYTNRVVLPVWAPRHKATIAFGKIADVLTTRKVF